jgi:hypothetical protein
MGRRRLRRLQRPVPVDLPLALRRLRAVPAGAVLPTGVLQAGRLDKRPRRAIGYDRRMPAACRLLAAVLAAPALAAQAREAVPFTAVRFTDGFWAARLETNRTVTIPHVLRKCEEEGRIANFRVAGGLAQGEQRGGFPFDDTDVYKVIEGASYALMLARDAELEARLDGIIATIAAAQESDGYLYTARTNGCERLRNWFGKERWSNLARSHELYNAGHLFEAAVAHWRATGKRSLLEVALRFAELIDREFGPGRREEPPGHQVIEMGLVRLFQATGERRWLTLAKSFLDMRGRPLGGRRLGGPYNQDHRPVLEQDEAVGHAVRASYMYAAMAEIGALLGDRDYMRAVDRLWEDVARSKLYLTGGIGATGSGEAFGRRYELPNMSAYNETCAAIGNAYWNQQMFLLHGDGRFADVLERTLYNGMLSGISLDGSGFFYPNPLESIGQHERTPWFHCACCTGNVTRFVASVAGYAYAVRDREIWVNLFAASDAEIATAAGKLRIAQRTRYPWDGDVVLELQPPHDGCELTLRVRIPGWARDEPIASDLYRFADAPAPAPTLAVNGERVPLELEGGYATLARAWNRGDTLYLSLPMPVRRVRAHADVAADRGRVALQRGPIVYCVEGHDIDGGRVRNLQLADDAELTTSFRADLLRGVQVIEGTAQAWTRAEDGALSAREAAFTAIPYHAWAHRGKGEMQVWLAREADAVAPLGTPTLASAAQVRASFGRNPRAVNDQLEPNSSIDHDVPFFHWWPHKGTTEWIEYDFGEPQEVSTVEVYWFDDTGIGECRLPQSWRALYLVDGNWQPVWTEQAWGIDQDTYNRVVFETVRTHKLRLEIRAREGFAGGIHEWRVR